MVIFVLMTMTTTTTRLITLPLAHARGIKIEGMAGSKSIQICRDNHIHYTSLRLLFSVITYLLMSTCSCYSSVSILDLHVGENIPYGSGLGLGTLCSKIELLCYAPML